MQTWMTGDGRYGGYEAYVNARCRRERERYVGAGAGECGGRQQDDTIDRDRRRQAKKRMTVHYGPMFQKRRVPCPAEDEAANASAPHVAARGCTSVCRTSHKEHIQYTARRRGVLQDCELWPACAASRTLCVQSSSCVSVTGMSMDGVSDTCDADRPRPAGTSRSPDVSGRNSEVVRPR